MLNMYEINNNLGTYVLNKLEENKRSMIENPCNETWMDGYLQAIEEAKDLILVDCVLENKHKEGK